MKTRIWSSSLIALLVLLAALAWGLVPGAPNPWWRMPVFTTAALVVGLLTRGVPARIWLAGAAVLWLVAAYAWNPTHQWAEGLGLLPVKHHAGWPGSADPSGTWEAWLTGAAVLAAYALTFRMNRRELRAVQAVLALGAAAMAVTVLLQRLDSTAGVIERTGLFVNENHFAVFSNLLFPMVLAMAARARFAAVQDGRPSSPAGLWLLVAALMGAAVVLSRSRAGVAVMALLVGAHVVHRLRLVRQYPFMGEPMGKMVRLAGAVAVALALGFAVAAFAREWRHMSGLAHECAFRGGILQDTLAIWKHSPVWGTGPGTFSVVFPYYQSDLFHGKMILHAHCEPVQFLAEFGWAGLLALALLALTVLTARRSKDRESEEMPPFAELERNAYGWGLTALALHVLIDFPLRIPLIAVLAAVLAGAWAGSRPRRSAGT